MSDGYCECECEVDYDSIGTCVTVVDVKAAVAHSCVECGEAIEPGQMYQRIKGLWGGHWDESATCVPCQHIRDDICSCAMIGCMRDDILEQLGFDYVTGELTAWAEKEDAR